MHTAVVGVDPPHGRTHAWQVQAWTRAAQIAARQYGVVSRAQCVSVGLDDTQLRRALSRSGRWQRVLPGVYATFTGPVPRASLLLAAVLFGGPHSQVTGVAALAWYGCSYVPHTSVVDVLIPWRLRRRPSGYVHFSRTRALPPPRLRAGIPLSPVERSALVAARHLPLLSDVRAVLAEVVQRRLTTVQRLSVELSAGPSAGSARLRRVLDDLGAGCRSLPEMELRDLVRSRPRLACQVRWNHPVAVGSGVVVADACWPEARVIVEVDSVEHHGLGDGPERTSRRRAALVTEGWVVLSVSPRRIREDAVALLDQIETLVTTR